MILMYVFGGLLARYNDYSIITKNYFKAKMAELFSIELPPSEDKFHFTL